jgi:hypothetical protein
VLESKLSACLCLAVTEQCLMAGGWNVLCLERLWRQLVVLGVLSFELGLFWGQASGGSPGLSLLAEATPLFFDESFWVPLLVCGC